MSARSLPSLTRRALRAALRSEQLLGGEPVGGDDLGAQALTDGTVDVADIYSSDPAIRAKNLVILSDPQMLILPQNVTPLVSASLPAIAVTAINRVSALLAPDELRALNRRSTGEKLSSKTIATDWLTSKKLL